VLAGSIGSPANTTLSSCNATTRGRRTVWIICPETEHKGRAQR
jgi:hypothetical protein